MKFLFSLFILFSICENILAQTPPNYKEAVFMSLKFIEEPIKPMGGYFRMYYNEFGHDDLNQQQLLNIRHPKIQKEILSIINNKIKNTTIKSKYSWQNYIKLSEYSADYQGFDIPDLTGYIIRTNETGSYTRPNVLVLNKFEFKILPMNSNDAQQLILRKNELYGREKNLYCEFQFSFLPEKSGQNIDNKLPSLMCVIRSMTIWESKQKRNKLATIKSAFTGNTLQEYKKYAIGLINGKWKDNIGNEIEFKFNHEDTTRHSLTGVYKKEPLYIEFFPANFFEGNSLFKVNIFLDKQHDYKFFTELYINKVYGDLVEVRIRWQPYRHNQYNDTFYNTLREGYIWDENNIPESKQKSGTSSSYYSINNLVYLQKQ